MRIADLNQIGILQSAFCNRLAEAAGVEPAHATRGGLADRCHTVRRRLQIWRRVQESNPQDLSPGLVFRTSCQPTQHYPPFAKFGRSTTIRTQTFGVGIRRAKTVDTMLPGKNLVHVVGLAPTKDNQVRLIYSQVPLLLSHTCGRTEDVGLCHIRNSQFEFLLLC